MKNLPRLLQEARVHKVKKVEYAFKLMMYPEPENSVWMKYIVKRFTKPENLVADVRSRSFSIAKARMLLSKHSMFIECSVDPSCVTEAILQLILLYVRHVLNKELETNVEEQSCSSAEV